MSIEDENPNYLSGIEEYVRYLEQMVIAHDKVSAELWSHTLKTLIDQVEEPEQLGIIAASYVLGAKWNSAAGEVSMTAVDPGRAESTSMLWDSSVVVINSPTPICRRGLILSLEAAGASDKLINLRTQKINQISLEVLPPIVCTENQRSGIVGTISYASGKQPHMEAFELPYNSLYPCLLRMGALITVRQEAA